MLKQNKGITLVALVITIIVLLILAGVSISLVVGENGVLSRATGAAEKSKRSQLKEAMDLALEDCQTEYIDYKYAGEEETIKDLEDMRYAVSPGRVAAALAKNGYELYKKDKTTSKVEKVSPLGTLKETDPTPTKADPDWGTIDDETTKVQSDETTFFVASGKDRLGVLVKVKRGTDGFPQISTAYATKLGTEVKEPTDDDKGDFEAFKTVDAK